MAPKNVTVVIGDRAELRVDILSYPEFALQWVKHDSEDANKAHVVQVELKWRFLIAKRVLPLFLAHYSFSG